MEKDKAVENSAHAEEDADAKKVDHLLECFRALTNGEHLSDIRKAILLFLSEINKSCLSEKEIVASEKRTDIIFNSVDLLLKYETFNAILNGIGLFLFKIHKNKLRERITLGEFVKDLEDIIIDIDEKYKLYKEEEVDDE